MIWIYSISLIIFFVILYFASGNVQWLLWKWFSKNPAIKKVNGCTVYLSSNMTWGLQGRFYPPDMGFVKRSYYTKDGLITNIEFLEATLKELSEGFQGTNDTIQHECIGHKKQYERKVQKYGKVIGTIFFNGWGMLNELGYWIGVYKVRSKMPIEREPEEAEKI